MNSPSVTSRIDYPLMEIDPQPDVITSVDDVLALVKDHEHHEYHRYHLLSLRFLAYHISISRLMEVLAAESQQRIQALIVASETLPVQEHRLQEVGNKAWRPPSPQSPHFFILNEKEAKWELSRAVLGEWRSRRFYERLQACNGIPGLHALLDACMGQAQAQLQILQEAENQLRTRLYSPCDIIR
ncbi:hypothetical protein [Halomonas sp.]|uniref:hypothetical protein n=1 Tax=Halomonas sp. TaxID=1486246 RepID=UPI0025C03DFC|nr:hypothetical protein [Halomonas sp.]